MIAFVLSVSFFSASEISIKRVSSRISQAIGVAPVAETEVATADEEVVEDVKPVEEAEAATETEVKAEETTEEPKAEDSAKEEKKEE